MYRVIILLLIPLLVNSKILLVHASSDPLKTNRIQQRLNLLWSLLNSNIWISQQVNPNNLPEPYNAILSQQLLTPAIEGYYKRTAIIRVIQANLNPTKQTYSRVIMMLLDPNKQRNDPLLAQKINEALAVELALIKIYFKELPKELQMDILNTRTPFGTLLKKHGIATCSTNRYYFKIQCNSVLARLIQCTINSPIYGRINTLTRVDNQQQIAQVVELLSGIKCQNKQCDVLFASY